VSAAASLTLTAPLAALRAMVRGGTISCDGVTLTALRHPVLTLCHVLAASGRADRALLVRFGDGRPKLLVASFRDTARWLPPGFTVPQGGSLACRASAPSSRNSRNRSRSAGCHATPAC
jgi:hypothetical protein